MRFRTLLDGLETSPLPTAYTARRDLPKRGGAWHACTVARLLNHQQAANTGMV